MKLACIFLLAILAVPAFAKTVIVSDIDDTIKISHTKGSFDRLVLAFSPNSRFQGMKELYKLLSQQVPDSKFIYVTHTPPWIFGPWQMKFLKNGGFPEGPVLFRQNTGDKEFKIRTLREIVNAEKPDQLILIGDNSELDPIAYDQITREVSPRIISHQFIRALYDKKGAELREGQHAFITPAEIALEMKALNVLPAAVADGFAKSISESAVAEKKYSQGKAAFFPPWLDCAKFEWTWETTGARHLASLRDRIYKACGRK